MAYSFPEKNYNSIDVARIAGAAVVVAAHTIYVGNAELEGQVFSVYYTVFQYLGRVVVPFFLISAGFLHYLRIDLNSFHFDHSRKYLMHYLRLHVLWTAIYFPLSFHGFFKHPKGFRHAVLAYLRNLIFTGADLQLWFIPTLIFAIFLVSLLLARGICPGHIVLIALVFYLIGLLGQSWFGLLLPLREFAPIIWNCLRLLGKVIVTTRNGLCYGFFFVSVGMFIAYYGITISRNKAAVCFLFSMVIMGIEVVVFQSIGFFREHDMCISLIPAAFFLFCTILKTNLPSRPLYKICRKASILIYFSHMLIKRIVCDALMIIGKPISLSFLLFVLTFTVSFGISYIIIVLSEKTRFRWLKNLY